MFSRALLRTAIRRAPLRVSSASARLAPSVFKTTTPRAFSSSTFNLSGTTPLSAKLSEELLYEQSSSSGSEEPEFLAAFKSQGIWTIDDQPGQDEITLSRSYDGGNEKVRVTFSISDLDSTGAEEALASELAEGQEEVQEEGQEQEEEVTGFPVRCHVVVTKDSAAGAVALDLTAQDGVFTIDNAAFYASAELATGLTSETDFQRRGTYLGPAFENLDESLQDEFVAYLEERGIDASLAGFVPEMAEWKEQKEYVKWLGDVSQFIEK